MTLESLPIEYIMTGRWKLAATSRMMSMDSASSDWRWESWS
jgi:hypothetical protein